MVDIEIEDQEHEVDRQKEVVDVGAEEGVDKRSEDVDLEIVEEGQEHGVDK